MAIMELAGARRGAGARKALPWAAIGTELRALLPLAAPLAAFQFGQRLMGVVDIAIVGRLGEVQLGAVGIGNSVYFTLAIFGLGIMLALDPLIAQALGAGERQEAKALLWQGAWLAFILSPILALTIGLATSSLEVIGISPVIAEQARQYVLARLPGLLPFLLFAGARSFLQAHKLVRPLVIAMIIANLINLPLSWLLVFGDEGLLRLGLPALGIPALGVAGAGWTTTLCSALQLCILSHSIKLQAGPPEQGLKRPRLAVLKQALGLGLPIALTLTAEVGAFSITNLLMARLAPESLAAHQVAMSLASMTFMVPLGIASATSVRVGQAVGRGDQEGTRRAGLVAIGVALGFMSIGALLFFFAGEQLARTMTDRQVVIDASIPLLLIAAVFQLSDGVQIAATGALRGAGDTRWPLWANLIGHYGVSLPFGALLCFHWKLGAPGLWCGLVLGLSIVAIVLSTRFWLISGEKIDRIASGLGEP